MRRRHSGQQPKTKSGRRPADKPRINRGSTAGFVPPTVYIGFPLFVLPQACPRGFSSIVWMVRGTVVSWANRPIGVPSCPSPPRPAVPPCDAPSRPACGTSGFWIRQIYASITSNFNLSSPKPGQTTGGSGRSGARRDGGAVRGRAGRDSIGFVRP